MSKYFHQCCRDELGFKKAKSQVMRKKVPTVTVEIGG